MAPSRELSAKVHTLIRRTIGQYYVNQAVKQGATRASVQPGSVTFLQRFGSSLNLNLHLHVIFLEGVYEDRTAQGLKPRFRLQEPPSDAEIAAVLDKISQRVIRYWRQRGYLEADPQDVAPTGYDPASDEDPEMARTMAASVQQRFALGERAGQKVRRIGSGFGDEGEPPTLTGTRCASVNGFSLHANTHVPAPPPRSARAAAALYCPWRGVPGASRRQRRWGPPLHLHPALVRWDHRHQASRPWS
jgi:hypothetical protein